MHQGVRLALTGFLAGAALLLTGCGSDDEADNSEGCVSTDSFSFSLDGAATVHYDDGGTDRIFASYENIVDATTIGIGLSSDQAGNTIEYVFVVSPGQTTGTFEASDPPNFVARAVAFISGVLYFDSGGTITVTEYGALGDKINGSFDVVLTDGVSLTPTLVGDFSATRDPDDFLFHGRCEH